MRTGAGGLGPCRLSETTFIDPIHLFLQEFTMETNPITHNPFNPGNGLSNGAVDHAATDMHGAVDRAAATAADAAGTVKPAIARATQMAHQTVDKVADVAGPTAAWLSAQGEHLASAQRTAVSDARAYISANPWQSLGVALAAGLLIGRMTRHD